MPEPKQAPIACVRCQRPLYFLGMKSFHEGSSPGVFGDLFEALQHKEELEMFACGYCGHVEYFVGGVGDQLRGWEPRKKRNWNPFRRGGQ